MVSKWPKRKSLLFSETHQSIVVISNEGYSMSETGTKLKLFINVCTTPFTEQYKWALTRIEKEAVLSKVFGSPRTSFVRCRTNEKMLEYLMPSVKHG